MSRIYKFALSAMVGGTALSADNIDSNSMVGGSYDGEGLAHDDAGNLYHIDAGSNEIHRITEVYPMAIDLSIFPGVAPDDFFNMTFATIVDYTASPPVPITRSSAVIIG